MLYRIRKKYLDILHLLLGDWQYFRYDQNKQEKNIIHTYYKESHRVPTNTNLVIFMANGFCNHAGLCDRLKGITTVYGWCKKHNKDFRIFHQNPFFLEDYLQPNQYDWRITPENIYYNKKHVSVNLCMLNHLTDKYVKSGSIGKLQKRWLNKRISSCKKQHHVYTNMYPDNNQFAQLFNELFRPTSRLEQLISKHQKAIGGNYISISFRFMQLLGDFKDCDGETLTKEQQQILINKSIKVIENVKQRHPKINTILVTSDSTNFIKNVKNIHYVYVIDGPIGHINYEGSNEVVTKTFLDFYMISNSQKVYLAKSEKMYNSDFSKRASMIHSRDFEIIDY